MSCSYYTFRQGDYYCNKKGDYVNSDVYYKYCRNYDYDDCPIYKGNSSGNCYLTSACVCAKDLPDDCYELKTLRDYRDNWLAKSKDGLYAIAHYYSVAPKIVKAINAMENSKSIYEAIFEKMVLPCICFIEQNRYEEAFELYREITLKLEAKYC